MVATGLVEISNGKIRPNLVTLVDHQNFRLFVHFWEIEKMISTLTTKKRILRFSADQCDQICQNFKATLANVFFYFTVSNGQILKK